MCLEDVDQMIHNWVIMPEFNNAGIFVRKTNGHLFHSTYQLPFSLKIDTMKHCSRADQPIEQIGADYLYLYLEFSR